MFLGYGFHHELEKGMPVRRYQCVRKFPVHLELAIRVLMVVLIRAPAQIEHVVADFRDHVIAPHHRLLVIAGLFRRIGRVRDFGPLGRQQKEFGLDAGLDMQPLGGGLGHQFAQHVAWGLRDLFALHHAIRRHPCDLGLPRQLDHGFRIGHRQHVGIGRGHVEPCGKTRKPRAICLHLLDGLRRDQLGPLAPEQIGVGDHEILDALVLGEFGEILHLRSFSLLVAAGGLTPPVTMFQKPFLPGYQSVPASGICAMAAASMVRAQRSSGSRLCTWFLPQARAMVWHSSVITLR